MGDDLKKLQEAMSAVRGHLQDLQNDQKATTRELKRLSSRSVHMEASMAALGGSFASIEQTLTKVLADHERVDALETENAAMKKTISDLTRRVDALEKKAS